jgi:hypothetical protein
MRSNYSYRRSANSLLNNNRRVSLTQRIRHVGTRLQQHDHAWVLAARASCGCLGYRRIGIGRRRAGAGGDREYRFCRFATLRNGTLPAGVRARLIPHVNGLTVNILEAGFETPGRPLVLMLHGFPQSRL